MSWNNEIITVNDITNNDDVTILNANEHPCSITTLHIQNNNELELLLSLKIYDNINVINKKENEDNIIEPFYNFVLGSNINNKSEIFPSAINLDVGDKLILNVKRKNILTEFNIINLSVFIVYYECLNCFS